MSARNIPKVKPHSIKRIDSGSLPSKVDSYIHFSFELLERNEYFNLDGTCQRWTSDLFDMLAAVSHKTVSELHSSSNTTFRVHDHRNAEPPCEIPQNIDLKDMYQIRISKSKGGIHGIFVENVFYIVWLDPLHNMYPDDRYGGLRKVKPPSTCCMERDEKINELLDELRLLTEEKNKVEEQYLAAEQLINELSSSE